MVFAVFNGGRFPVAARGVVRLLGGLVFSTSLVLGMAAVAVGESSFEIVVSIDTVVRAPEGSETLLAAQPVPTDLVGETCSVIARSTNQSSVHPGNDLIVESRSRVVLADVEDEPGGTVTATDTMDLGEEVQVTLVMGPDEVFSAGVEVLFDCPPEPTTTTSPTDSTSTTAADSTTTTISASTTTTDGLSTTTTIEGSSTTTSHTTTTTPGSTTTTEGSSTTTSHTTTTTPGSTTTTVGLTTTTTPIEDEELVHTGPPDRRLALLAVALTVSGALLVAGEKSAVLATDGPVALLRRRCNRCPREAEFMTPHGRLCKMHTRMALHEDTVLWMPVKLGRRRER